MFVGSSQAEPTSPCFSYPSPHNTLSFDDSASYIKTFVSYTQQGISSNLLVDFSGNFKVLCLLYKLLKSPLPPDHSIFACSLPSLLLLLHSCSHLRSTCIILHLGLAPSGGGQRCRSMHYPFPHAKLLWTLESVTWRRV